jgi:hypothetical protein
LYEELHEKDIINEINIKFNNEKIIFKKNLIEIKIKSIKSDIEKVKYVEKKYICDCTIYYYKNKTIRIY